MLKDFDKWNIEKQKLELTGHLHLPFHEREIWWCSLGLNLGHEQDGKNYLYERPVLVVKKFSDQLAWVIPISTKIKTGNYYYNLYYQGKISSVMLSQLRLVSIKRFRRFVRKISPHQDLVIKQKLGYLLNLI